MVGGLDGEWADAEDTYRAATVPAARLEFRRTAQGRRQQDGSCDAVDLAT